MAKKETAVEGVALLGCCFIGILALVLEVVATVWAIVDLTGDNSYKVLDIVILVIVGLSLFGGVGARAGRS